MKRRMILGVIVLLAVLAGNAATGTTRIASAAVVSITHSNSMNITQGNSVACSPDGGVTTEATSYYRVFNLPSFGIESEFIVSAVEFGVENVTQVPVLITVKLYTIDGDLLLENLTLIGSSDVTLQPTQNELVTVPVEGVAPAGSILVVEISAPNLSGVGGFYIGSNSASQTGQSYIMTEACSLPEITDVREIGSPGMHIVMNVTGETGPTIGEVEIIPTPSNEGEPVTASANFTAPDSASNLACTVDYGDGSEVQAGTIANGVCTGPEHTYSDDRPDGYDVTVVVCDGEDCDQASVAHTVNNLPPTIASITIDAPVSQDDPATITVNASDPGIFDVLMYSFDCDDNGFFDIGPQTGDTADCPLDPAAATTTITILVEDGDGGSDTASVEVNRTVTVCTNSHTGAVSSAPAGECPSGTQVLMVSAASAAAFCINPYTGSIFWSAVGECSGAYLMHVAPDDGPLTYCQNVYTGQLRYSPTGQCSPHETPGVIPGNDLEG